MSSDEAYVIDLCDEVLNEESSRQHRFDFLKGDPDSGGRCVNLPVDAYYLEHNLVIEFRERQHTEPVAFFDKPDRITVSGVSRGEQRTIYDLRRSELIPLNGIKYLEITYSDFKYDSSKKIIRDLKYDQEVVKSKLISIF